jgi:hypothetical protein
LKNGKATACRIPLEPRTSSHSHDRRAIRRAWRVSRVANKERIYARPLLFSHATRQEQVRTARCSATSQRIGKRRVMLQVSSFLVCSAHRTTGQGGCPCSLSRCSRPMASGVMSTSLSDERYERPCAMQLVPTRKATLRARLLRGQLDFSCALGGSAACCICDTRGWMFSTVWC